MLVGVLTAAGFSCFYPRGAYYVMTDVAGFGFPDDLEFVRFLTEKIGVAAVPGTSFYSRRALGRGQVRFCFCKKYETLELVNRKFDKWKDAGPDAPLGKAQE